MSLLCHPTFTFLFMTFTIVESLQSYKSSRLLEHRRHNDKARIAGVEDHRSLTLLLSAPFALHGLEVVNPYGLHDMRD